MVFSTGWLVVRVRSVCGLLNTRLSWFVILLRMLFVVLRCVDSMLMFNMVSLALARWPSTVGATLRCLSYLVAILNGLLFVRLTSVGLRLLLILLNGVK